MAGTETIWRRARWAAMALALAATALALAGLRSELASAGPTAQASRAKVVDIDDFAFHPPRLTVEAGTKVDFTNSSGVTHTATRSGAFNTGRIKPGTTIGVRFKQKGTFAYHCSIHPFMHGTIVVN
ncbi:MAG: cupredoxin domain-containing protein [Solirubrobacterales bacterium]